MAEFHPVNHADSEHESYEILRDFLFFFFFTTARAGESLWKLAWHSFGFYLFYCMQLNHW